MSDNVLCDNEFCCDGMKSEIERFEQNQVDIDGHPLSVIWYAKDIRRYHIMYSCADYNDVSGVPIQYCPFCGAKLPKELDDYDMEPFLRKEYGWTDEDCWGYPRRELPAEFKTDEWWKKRGL